MRHASAIKRILINVSNVSLIVNTIHSVHTVPQSTDNLSLIGSPVHRFNTFSLSVNNVSPSVTIGSPSVTHFKVFSNRQQVGAFSAHCMNQVCT